MKRISKPSWRTSKEALDSVHLQKVQGLRDGEQSKWRHLVWLLRLTTRHKMKGVEINVAFLFTHTGKRLRFPSKHYLLNIAKSVRTPIA